MGLPQMQARAIHMLFMGEVEHHIFALMTATIALAVHGMIHRTHLASALLGTLMP